MPFTPGQELCLKSLEDSYDKFIVPIRMGDGLSIDLYNSFVSAIRRTSLEWSGDNVIPKAAAGIFTDVYGALLASSYIYNEKNGDEIRRLAEVIAQEIRSCLDNPEELQ